MLQTYPLIDWDSPTFGQPGANVHVSSTGSWLGEGGHHGSEGES